jgi:membrane protease YdiL (CAAX protease family)
MSETDNNLQGQKPKISAYAIASVCILLVIVAYWFAGARGFLNDISDGIVMCWSFANLLGPILCPILSIKALREIKRSNGQITGKTIAVIGFLTPIIVIYMCTRYFPTPT